MLSYVLGKDLRRDLINSNIIEKVTVCRKENAILRIQFEVVEFAS